jgi:hypothetical protein
MRTKIALLTLLGLLAVGAPLLVAELADPARPRRRSRPVATGAV